MPRDWKEFWHSYRRGPVESDDDLFIQVGRTVGGEPISADELALAVEQAAGGLRLTEADTVFEYCCGNGLLSYELAPRVRGLIGIDFAEHLIESARARRHRPNIEYHVGDALEPIDRFIGPEPPTKYLMGLALAHFSPIDLATILTNLLRVSEPGAFLFLITGIPDVSRKWNFYDTPERRARHLENERRGDFTNDGMGRWWSEQEIVEVAQACGLKAGIEPEPADLNDYRMQALIG